MSLVNTETGEVIEVVEVGGALVPVDPTAALDTTSDPDGMVLALAEQAKQMLVQAQGLTGLAQVVEAKAVAETIKTWTHQKDVSQEAADAAIEMVRRIERRIGELIREGQAEGTITRKARHGVHDANSISPAEFIPGADARVQTYAMTDDVSDEQFEEALAEAKDEGNLSRANVARKAAEKAGKPLHREHVTPIFKGGVVHPKLAEAKKNNPVKPTEDQIAKDIEQLAARGNNSRQIAAALSYDLGSRPDEKVRKIARSRGIALPEDITGRVRKLDPNRLIGEAVIALDGASFGLDLVSYEELDQDQIEGWVSSLDRSMPLLKAMHKRLKEKTQ